VDTCGAGERDPPADEHQDLAERYAPMVWIARGEKNGPADADQFIRDSQLWFDHGKICKDDDPVAADVDAKRLAAGDYHHEVAAQPHAQSEDPLSCNHDSAKIVSSDDWLESSPDGPGGGKGFNLDLADEHREGDGTGSPVYWQYRSDGGRAVIVYWLFYAYNDSTNNHEGDWERVAVQLDGERATGVTFWKHEQPACVVPWDDLDHTDGHPVTYSAKGAHGSYPKAGNFVHVGGTDTTSHGERWQTWRQVRHADTQQWYGYAGLWGVTGPKWFSGIPGPHDKRDLSEANTTLACPSEPKPTGYFGDWVSPEPVVQPDSPATYTMRVRLRDGQVGDVVGEVDYPGLECSGRWILLGKPADKLVLREQIDEERGTATCTKTGELELTLTDAGMHFAYTRDGETEDTATAELVRR
jgi:hypothetical protein